MRLQRFINEWNPHSFINVMAYNHTNTNTGTCIQVTKKKWMLHWFKCWIKIFRNSTPGLLYR